MHIITTSGGSIGASRAAEATESIDRLSATAHQAVDRAADVATSAVHQIAERGHRLASAGDYWASATRDCVRRHPIASVGVALGAGLLLSLLTRRSR